MYQIISAIAQSSEPGSPWGEVSVQNKSISSLFSEYTQLYLRVRSPFWTTERTVTLSELRRLFTDTSITLAEFFTQIGNEAIPSRVGTASIESGRVTFADAYWAGYTLSRGVYQYTPEHIPQPEDANVLVMRKPGVSARDFHKYCLVTVNGLIHRVDADASHVYVIDAPVSARHCHRAEVGILSFAKVGALECVSLKEEHITRLHPSQPMANQLMIKSPVAPQGRTAALVMGGYLFVLDNLSFSRNAEDTFVLDVQNVSLLERFWESRRLMDMDFLGLEYGGANKMQVSTEQLLSDAVLKKWLTCSQSFLVFIDTDNLQVEREQLMDSTSFGDYITDVEPTSAVVFGSGLMPVYWKQYDEGKWAVSLGDNFAHDYLHATTPKAMAPMPSDNRKPYARQKYRRAYLTHISTQKVVIS